MQRTLEPGKQQSIKITAPKKLSKEEIEKMVRQAEQFASDDAKKKEEVEAINQADTPRLLGGEVPEGLRRQGEPGRARRYRGKAERPEVGHQGQECGPHQEEPWMPSPRRRTSSRRRSTSRAAGSQGGQQGPGGAGPQAGPDRFHGQRTAGRARPARKTTTSSMPSSGKRRSSISVSASAPGVRSARI